MTREILGDLVQVKEPSDFGKSFLGVGIGTDGVPIDFLKVYLLGHVIPDYTILITDSFSSKRMVDNGLNVYDLEYAIARYKENLDIYSKIFSKKVQVLDCSLFMEKDDYLQNFNDVRDALQNNDDILDKVKKIDPERGKSSESKLNFTLHEIAVVDYLNKRFGVRTKIGPQTERRYDDVIKSINNSINFSYLYRTYSVSREDQEPSLYAVEDVASIPTRRVLITDDPDTIEAKLELASTDALRYFANIGSLAGRMLGKECLSRDDLQEIVDRKILLEIAQSYIIDNLIAPFRRQGGKSVYKKTHMRQFYDDTFRETGLKFFERQPDLSFIREELDVLNRQIIRLLKERSNYGYDPVMYDSRFPHIEDLNIHPTIVDSLYKPILSTVCKEDVVFDKKIRGIDLELMSTLQKRLSLNHDVAIAKLKMSRSIYDGEREQAVLSEAVKYGDNVGLNKESITPVFKLIMDGAKELQQIILSRYEIDKIF